MMQILLPSPLQLPQMKIIVPALRKMEKVSGRFCAMNNIKEVIGNAAMKTECAAVIPAAPETPSGRNLLIQDVFAVLSFITMRLVAVTK